MISKTGNETWIRYCQDLARLRRDLEQNNKDCEFKEDNGTIFYIADISAINFFIDPAGMVKNIHIFRDRDDENDFRAVAYRLSEFLFLEQGLIPENSPFYILTPHVTDLLNMLDDTSKQAVQEKHGQVNNNFNNSNKNALCLDGLNGRHDQNELVNKLIQCAPHLMMILYDGEESISLNKLKRFSQLGIMDRLLNANTNEILLKFDTQKINCNNMWKSYLHDANSQRSDPELERDAKVLQWLIDANQHFVDKNLNYQIHLLTCDDTVISAFESYRQSFINPKKRPTYLLRHLRQFIPLILQNTSCQNNHKIIKEMIELLDRFFQPLKSPHKDRRKQDRNTTDRRKYSREYSDVLTCIQFDLSKNHFYQCRLSGQQGQDALINDIKFQVEQWTDMLNNSALHADLSKFQKSKNGLLKGIASMLLNDTMDELFNERLHKTFKSLQNGYSRLGFLSTDLLANAVKAIQETEKIKKPGIARRATIELYFDDDNTSFQNYHTNLRQAIEAKDICFISDKLDHMTPYIINLTHAMLSADLGEWDVCCHYCEMAIKDAQSQNNEYPHEAAYLMAFALRHKCNQIDDIHKALDYLQLANEAWIKCHTGVDRRLKVERLALTLTFHNINKFLYNKNNTMVSTKISKMSVVWNELWDLYNENEVKSIPKRIKKDGDVALWEQWLYRQLVLNLCSIYIFHNHVEKIGIRPDTTITDKLQKIFYECYNIMLKDKDSYMTHFVKLIFDWHFSQDMNKSDTLQMLETHINDIKQNKIPLLCYEENKFNFILKTLKETTNTASATP
ncbi:MAG: hypothetical protein H7839_09130 [Magnetococcus sp. YQC-5]